MYTKILLAAVMALGLSVPALSANVGETPSALQPQSGNGPLISVSALQEVLAGDRPQVIDIRAPRSRKALFSYAAGHVPGAVNVPYGKWREVWSDPNALPSDAELTKLVRGAGLVKARRVVIVHSGAAKGNFGSAAFVYWMLKSAGFTNLAILDGGHRAWKAAGGALSKTAPAIVPSAETVAFADTWLATHEDVDAVLAGQSSAHLVDSRPATGSDTLDGAHAISSTELLTGRNGKAGDLLGAFSRLKNSFVGWQNREVITYCDNGSQAATNWFMASEISGIPNVKIYGHSLNARKARQSATSG